MLIAAWVVDIGLGREVLLIAPHDPSAVALNRELYSPGESVPDLYGNPMSDPVRVIHPDPNRLITPEEDTGLILMTVVNQAGENPLQAQTIWFFTRFAFMGLILLGVLGFAFRTRRHRADLSPQIVLDTGRITDDHQS